MPSQLSGTRPIELFLETDSRRSVVPGCDGSVLLNSTKTNIAERDAIPIRVYEGGHTIGTSHCNGFTNRLYNFTGKGDTDPTLDPNYIVKLRQKCKPGDTKTLVEMDPGSFKTFDEAYFTLVAKIRGLFQSDAALLDDPETKAYVILQASTHGSTFAEDFAESMVKMGQAGVLTGNQGEIRKHCAFVN
ncbi:Peroxidase 1 [Hibiscus syriacus]|uniref:peroxidase n=1 Tax=Hibiscus syriacus TaxID=106335 RepID=A0A6A3BWK2_HIBSY|nr:Peroxidase 1 [Hibiscus syriacus]